MGRLIDADALMERVDESRRDNPHRDGKISVNHINEHSHFLDMIIEAPTIDAEPVRWRQIPGFEGLYEINNLAQIRNAKGDVLKQQIRREKYTCYKVVHLWKDGKYHNKGVHRLMAETFLPNPDGLPVVNHKDEDGTNNLLSNLEWCDRSYNASYGSAPKKISKAFKGK